MIEIPLYQGVAKYEMCGQANITNGHHFLQASLITSIVCNAWPSSIRRTKIPLYKGVAKYETCGQANITNEHHFLRASLITSIVCNAWPSSIRSTGLWRNPLQELLQPLEINILGDSAIFAVFEDCSR